MRIATREDADGAMATGRAHLSNIAERTRPMAGCVRGGIEPSTFSTSCKMARP